MNFSKQFLWKYRVRAISVIVQTSLKNFCYNAPTKQVAQVVDFKEVYQE